MITDNHYHVGIRPHFDPLLFSEVSHESGSRKNDEENIIAHDGDGSIDRNHRPYVEGQGTVLGGRSHYFFHREHVASTIQIDVRPYRESNDRHEQSY